MEKNDFLFGVSFFLFIFAFESKRVKGLKSKVKGLKSKVKG